MSEGSGRDERWFEAMVLAELPAVAAYAARRVADPDEVVAEVFAVAWAHRNQLPTPVRPWLFRVAHHQVMHAHRSRVRRSNLVARLADRTFATQVEDHAANVGDQLDAADAVRAALGQLRPADQEILRLHAWEQLSLGEIATVLDCTVTAVKVRLHRARKRLAERVLSLPMAPDERFLDTVLDTEVNH